MTEIDVGEGRMVTVAFAELAEATALCAVTVTGLGDTLEGAVYRPVGDIVPTVEFPPTMPATNQFTAVLVVPETAAVNCVDRPTWTLAAVGEIVTEIDVGEGRTVTVAFPELAESTALCAVTVTGLGGTLDGAEYIPVGEIVPTAEFPPTTPATFQFTALLVVPETAAVNCFDKPTCTLAVFGETVTETDVDDGRIVTVAESEFVELTALCAVTVTGAAGTLDGALYRPVADIVPTVEFPPTTPPTSQITAVFLVPETVAVNCWDRPTCTLVLLGEIDTETLWRPDAEPTQAAHAITARSGIAAFLRNQDPLPALEPFRIPLAVFTVCIGAPV